MNAFLINNIKSIFICAIFLFALGKSEARAETFVFEGKPYSVERLGSVVKVFNQSAQAKLSLISGRGSATDCGNIERNLENRRYLIERCKENPGESFCRSLVWSLRLLAEGRPEADRPMPSDYQQIWLIQRTSNHENADGLREAIARTLGIAAEKVEIEADNASGEPLSFSEITIELAEDAMLSKIQPILQFDRENLMGISRGKWITHNVMLACDIAAGKVSYQGKRTLQTSHVERIPEGILQSVWRGYEILSREFNPADEQTPLLTQAALVGYEIAHAYPKTNSALDDARLKPEHLFRSLFETKEGVMRLRFFSSQNGMRAVAYPDQSFQASVEQTWRLQ